MGKIVGTRYLVNWLHLGEIKWRGIFNLLPSEEGGKLSEREVNLVEIRRMRNLMTRNLINDHENEDGASVHHPQTQYVSSHRGLK